MIRTPYCTDTIDGQRPSTRAVPTWRGWLGEGWRLFRDDAGALFSLLVVWHRRAAMRQHLRNLDDRMLRDIGLSRADIEAEAAKSFWRQ